MKEYEVVISGISGGFPGCMDLDGLQNQLYDTNDDNIVSLDSKGFFKNGECDQPEFIGVTEHNFDFKQFGLSCFLETDFDFNVGFVLENAYEAIIDAGVNPLNLKGSNCGVVVSVGTTDNERMVQGENASRYQIISSSKGMSANRISFHYGLTGPSFIIHGSLESSLTALDVAARLVAKGNVTQAIVASSHCIGLPQNLWHGSEDGIPVLSSDGKTRSFSQNASGFAWSEGSVALFLQRKEDALRYYGKIEKSMTSALPKQEQHISSDTKLFMRDFYDNVNFDPEEIAYIEADGIGIPELDRMELEGLLDSVCHQRKSSLPVSCCKSKLGHCCTCSSLVSVVHSLLASQGGHVPPTLHYCQHQSDSHPTNDPRIKIVTEKTPAKGSLYGVSSFGLGMVGCHIVVSQNDKSRQSSDILGPEDPPALILISGRDKPHMEENLKRFSSSSNDKGYVALVHKAFAKTYQLHTTRGFAITNSPVPVIPVVEVCDYSSLPPVWFMFSGMGSQWNRMGADLLKLPFTAASLHRSHQVLLSKNVDLISIITSTDPLIYQDVTNSFVGIAAIQVALVDFLYALGIKPDRIIGHSVGELGCGYADGCLTAEQTVLSAYARGRASQEATLNKGMMAAVGRGYMEIKNSLPNDIEVACHNSPKSCTLSGPTEIVEEYVEKLKNDGVFAKTVNVSNIAYHSKHIVPAGPLLLKYMKEILVNPVERSSKWLCTSVQESLWDEAKMCSAEYYTNNLLSPVLFEEAAKYIPEEALVIEIAPHGLLQAIVKRSHPKCFHVPLTSRTAPNNLVHLLEALGRIYLLGFDMDLSPIYPEVSFPVPRETKILSPLVSWDHSDSGLRLMKPGLKKSQKMFNEYFSCKSEEAVMMKENYIIDGEPVTALSFILDKIKSTLAQQRSLTENGFLEFTDVTVHSLLQVPLKRNVPLSITLLGGGEFSCIDEEGILKVSGVVHEDTSRTIDSLINENTGNHSGLFLIQQKQIYSQLENIGYRIGGPLKNIMQMELSSNGFVAKVSLQDGSKYILDSMILSVIFHTFYFTGKKSSLESFRNFFVQKTNPSFIENKDFVTLHYSVMTGAVSCDGMFLSGLRLKTCATPVSQLNVTQLRFLPLHPSETMKVDDFYYACIQVVCQDIQHRIKQIFIMEVDGNYIDQNKIVNLLSMYSKQVQFNTLLKEELVCLAGITPEENNDCSFMLICTANRIPDEIMSLCQMSDNNFALVLTEKQYPLVGQNEMECLFNCELENARAHLLKKKQAVQINKSTILDSSNTEWKQQIKNLVKSGSPNPSYFVSHMRMYSEVMSTHRQCCDSIQVQNLRFVFYDDSCPKFDLKNSFYKSHLEKGFNVNVCQASKWGHLVHLPTQMCFGDNNNDIVLDNISSDLVSLECVSFNPKVNKLSCEVVEYEGKVDNNRVIGVGTLENEILKPDPVLHWEYCQFWKVQEACTVPVFYSMAYYMISVMAKLKEDSMVLVIGGDSPAGEAAIRVASSIGASISVVCSSETKIHAIKQLFPQLDTSKMYLIQKNTFLTDVHKLTSGAGYQLVMNFLPDMCLIKTSTRCMAERRVIDAEQRYYFQISVDPLENNLMFGQEIFLKGVSLMSCNPEQIVNLIYEKKIKVRDCVEQGIKTGVVKPLKYIHLSRPVTKSSTIQKHRNNYEKFLVSLYDSNKSSFQSAKRKKSQLFIGNGDLYFNLIYRLMSQSNEITHLVFDEKSMSSPHLKRLSSIVQSFKDREVCLHSFSKLSTAGSCEAFVRSLQKDYCLEKAVIMTQGMPTEAWRGLEQLGGECRVCLVGADEEGWCQARIRQGHPSVCVVPEPNLHVSSVLPLLEALHSSCSDAQGTYYIQQPSSNTLGCRSERNEVLPADMSELLELAHSLSDDVCFTEVPTNSSPYLTSINVSPIFLIPGFRVMQFKKLAYKLQHPAFIASFPKQLPSLHQLASQLKKCLTENFHQKIYTLVCEGWSAILAFKVAQLLAEDERECQIFLLGQSVSQIQKSLSELSKLKLMKQYFPLADVKKGNRDIFTEKGLYETVLSERDSPMAMWNSIQLNECFSNIVDAASMVSKVNEGTIHHSAYVTHIRPFMAGELFRSPDLEKMCKRRVFVHCVDTEDIFQSEDLAGIISDYTFHELPGLVNKQNLYKQQETCYFGQDLEQIKQVIPLF